MTSEPLIRRSSLTSAQFHEAFENTLYGLFSLLGRQRGGVFLTIMRPERIVTQSQRKCLKRQLVRRRTWLARWSPAHLKLQLKNVWGQTVSFIFRLSQRLCGDLSLLIHHWQEQEVTVCQKRRVHSSRASKLCHTLPSSGQNTKTHDREIILLLQQQKHPHRDQFMMCSSINLCLYSSQWH